VFSPIPILNSIIKKPSFHEIMDGLGGKIPLQGHGIEYFDYSIDYL
jgi:hypothetical protein